ncbi:hypothetical protein A1343_04840 [Leptospira interrogans serovar Bataviae]|nr:hypothetical protein [Leptospira interrogans serovar Bataviae]OAM76776.1 hypothetical protein A1343_04840 [Leptospira interrogans serovar Bataviae]
MTFYFYLETCLPIQINPNSDNLHELPHNVNSLIKNNNWSSVSHLFILRDSSRKNKTRNL